MTSTSRRLKVVIVGAGIGGLAAAVGIAQQGHHVCVFEGESELSEIGAGIQIPPNAMRILEAWGLKDVMYSKCDESQGTNVRRYSDGTLIGRQRHNMEKEFGFGNAVMHRADLQQILYKAAIHAGVEVTLGKEIRWSDISVWLATDKNSCLPSADLVVAAGGIRSNIRSQLFPEVKYRPRRTGERVFRCVLPRDVVHANPQLAHLVEQPTNTVWMGPGRHVVVYTIRGTQLLNVVLTGRSESGPIGIFNEPADLAEVQAAYADFDPVVRGIIACATTCHKWHLSEVPPLPDWTDPTARVVLLGDTAHAMLPYMAQGAAMCIEDAAVLASCLTDIRGPTDLSERIRLYTTIRKPRAERVQAAAAANADAFGLEDGPAQQTRDARFRASLDEATHSASATNSHTGEAQASPYEDKEFRNWLFGYDAIRETHEQLAGLRYRL